RGTLQEPIGEKQLLLRDAQGQVQAVAVDGHTKYAEGLYGDIPTNETRIPPGTRLIVEVENGRAVRVVHDYSGYEVPALWVDQQVLNLAQWAGPDSLFGNEQQVKALLGVVLVSLVCGMVSSLVVSNRMAFFSDALAHCAFAGFGLACIISLFGLYAMEDQGGI